MKLLFFDTETNGLPKAYNASYEDVDNWPRVISIAWMLCELDGSILDQQHHLLKPDGWEIPNERFWLDNGFSTEESMEKGVPIDPVLDQFMAAKGLADVLVAHNINFDHRIVWAEIIRSGRRPRSGMEKICTMMKSTSFCKIPKAKGGGYKWPKLEELHDKLFGYAFSGAHDALADVIACKNCLFELVRLGVITLPSIVKDPQLDGLPL